MPQHLPFIMAEYRRRKRMAKDRKPAEELSGFANQTMEQARNALDIYFEYLKKAVSSMPSGGTELGDKLKSCAEANLASTHQFMRQLSQAKDFQEMLRIQAEFMQSLGNAMGEQTKELTEAASGIPWLWPASLGRHRWPSGFHRL
jgi:hypothetical protein